jgi:hypothetical protein
MLRFESAGKYVERYHGFVSCALNMEDLITKDFFVNSTCSKQIYNVFSVHITKQLTDL